MILSNEDLYSKVSDLAHQYCLGYPLAMECLDDDKRTLAFMDIISKTIPDKAVAVDLGVGSGILSFAAINAGASIVYASDIRPDLVELSKKIAEKLGFSDRFKVYVSDVNYFHPPEEISYVIAELVQTGLHAEPIVAAMKNIKKYTRHGALFIPETAVSTVTIQDGEIPLSEPCVYDTVHFPTNIKTWVNSIIEIPITKEGIPTTPVLNTRLLYPGGFETGAFMSLCPPVTEFRIPHAPLVKPGDIVRVHLQYYYGDALRLGYLGKK